MYVLYVCSVCTYMHMQESPTEEEENYSVFVWIESDLL